MKSKDVVFVPVMVSWARYWYWVVGVGASA